MSAEHSKTLSFTVPLIIVIMLLPGANGLAQTIAAVVATIATTGFVLLAARFGWAPLLKKAGFWWSSLLLGCAIVAVGLVAAATGVKLGGPASYAWKLAFNSAIAGLLFSWALAAVRGARESKRPNPPSAPMPRSVTDRANPRSVLAAGPTDLQT